MSWKIGWSWTENNGPLVHSGPFYFNPKFLNLVEFYIGFRPTAPGPIGWGNEGLLVPVAQWLKKKGWGNFGIALRKIKVE